MMKIVIEQSHYSLVNMGDLSMLQVAVSRLKNLWPDASIKVFAYKQAEDLLEKYCPKTDPVIPSGQDVWLTTPLSDRLTKLMSNSSEQLKDLEWQIRYQFPSMGRWLVQRRLKKRKQLSHYEKLNLFLNAIEEADLVVAAGGGYITDAFENKATKSLTILGLATKLGKPTVMLGHGLGPLDNPKLRTKAKAILPKVNLISLREKRAGIPLLKSLGVSPQRIMTTGDDAIELVYDNRSLELGNAIGVNLRIARYSDVNADLLETVRTVLQQAAASKGAPLLPVPIEFYDLNSDVRTIKEILAGYDDTSDAGDSLRTPVQVIKQAGRCRVVVTGSYHAGVFALAQGIPVVGLAKSEYYKDKFLGLADIFGKGCEVVFLDDTCLKEKLMAGIDKAWQSAEELRPYLLESASQQAELGRSAYQKVYKLVESYRS